MRSSGDAPLPPSSVDALLESSLKDIGIPPRPTILDRISREMLRDEPDYKRLSNIIGADVSLSASLIKTANSPFFGYRNRVRSVNEALMMLGLDVASRAIAGIILRKVFPNSLHLERFWDASARIARLSGWLAQHVGHNKLRPDDAYTFGLFRDCGIPVLLQRFPGYEKILDSANSETNRSFTVVQNSQLPRDAVHHPAADQPLPDRHGTVCRTPDAATYGTEPYPGMAEARHRLPAVAGCRRR
ncbi:MAG: HDOD domain-containing protein [Sulfuritalea sp.]|nr:HDOD domain-containing protein [Sulfuritalea sp.]